MSTIPPFTAEKILDAIAAGAKISAACKLASVAPSAFDSAARRDPALARRLVAALDAAEDILAERLRDALARNALGVIKAIMKKVTRPRVDYVAIAEQEVAERAARARARNDLLLAKAEFRVAVGRLKAKDRAEAKARAADRAPLYIEEVQATGQRINMHQLRHRDQLRPEWTTHRICPVGVKELLTSRDMLVVQPWEGPRQMLRVVWALHLPTRPKAYVVCACGQKAAYIYPGKDGRWGCAKCSITGERYASESKHRPANRVRVQAPVFDGVRAHELCKRDAKGIKFVRLEKSARMTGPPDPAPVYKKEPLPEGFVEVPW